ncbi:ABC-type nitrate/sulfonate/bicarbonate transport system permease component [Cytobacillus oceanisediminis]|uniref:ABC-type nitrate/sulfonate/bicarbonate transport system permease component n=1 Tax=Cytobacillus oceanisediminis TaxID=665099 RepID=A0A2V2ZHP6_9BACI|nr:ABC transporter permease [Cytobacillus oceanisediminis]PWW19449.1 ABC-type nitrate/sulfonate/bicarbonate transport system permease component [Cytobacillus oceanisediminis]
MKNVLMKGWRPAAVLLLLFIVWELAVLLAEIPAWLLPPPTDIFQEAITGWDGFRLHLQSTVMLSLLGFAIGTGIGLLTAVLLHLLPFLRESIYPLLILSQNVPIIVLAPLLVVWFGFGILPKLIVITLVCFFPITVAALDGFRQTPRELKHYMLMAGASKGQLFWKLELPYSLPSLFSGLKISATYSVMGAVISEWLGAKAGIGVYMTLASSSFRTDRVFVAIFAIMVLSLLFFGTILLAERLLVKWKTQESVKK